MEELMPSNCGAGDYSRDYLGQQGDQANLKGNQPSTHVGGTDTEAETPVYLSSDVKSWLIGKVPDVGEIWV